MKQGFLALIVSTLISAVAYSTALTSAAADAAALISSAASGGTFTSSASLISATVAAAIEHSLYSSLADAERGDDKLAKAIVTVAEEQTRSYYDDKYSIDKCMEVFYALPDPWTADEVFKFQESFKERKRIVKLGFH
uniref:Uncharacterized protein n=1 Tax=Ananas comosus var. bracteatus TaxID=296719 RepID=A0A6V7QHQ5_ANACO|nr:unnamed protein product [Ananas comosus var. bracteatus]